MNNPTFNKIVCLYMLYLNTDIYLYTLITFYYLQFIIPA